MSQSIKSVAQWMAERGLDLPQIVRLSALDEQVVHAIVQGRYTPSPQQRQQLATALGLAPDEIAWGHATPVEHLYGHGTQFGRSP